MKARAVVKLTRLYKDQSSGGNGCPTVYLGDNGELVVQGQLVDGDTFAELENVLPGEGAVRIDPVVVLGAIEQYRAAGQR
ncbi:hypothetical protein GCM10023322_75610 [Rugosimonospora acidiphila]|uniref:Uncharacterized protein n=1 Tax=Rugosimonospora acidiphila TaxID=556531 RepID=A0ABP9SR38_9ACTN